MAIHDHDTDATRRTGTLTRRRSLRSEESHFNYLLATDETGLAELEAALATLPICARGRVFIEVDSVDDAFVVEVPTRMTVTWLPRSRRSGAPGTGARCTRGEAVTRAVAAWSDEMLCDSATTSRIWLGGDYRSVSGCFEHLTGALNIDRGTITVPPEYRLR